MFIGLVWRRNVLGLHLLGLFVIGALSCWAAIADSVNASEQSRFGDCSQLQMPTDKGFSCSGNRVGECALSKAIDAGSHLGRCDHKISAYASIAGTINKAKNICGDDCELISQAILAKATRALSMIPNPKYRISPSWSIALSMMVAGDYQSSSVIASKLKPAARSTVYAWGAWNAALRCELKKTVELLAEAQPAADQANDGHMKVRAYTWIAQVYQWIESKKSIDMMVRARNTLNAVPMGNSRRWAGVYYGIGLATIGREEELNALLANMTSPYDRSYVLSFSAVTYANFQEHSKSRDAIALAEHQLTLVNNAYQRDGLLAVLSYARILNGMPSRAEEIVDVFSKSRAYQRTADGLIARQNGVLSRSCEK